MGSHFGGAWTITGGAATSGGTVEYSMTWVSNATKSPVTVKISVDINTGDSRENIVDALIDKAKNNPQLANDFTIEKKGAFGFDGLWVDFAPKSKDVQISSGSYTNKGSAGSCVKGLGFGVGGSGDPPPSYVDIFGTTGASDDLLTVFLARPSIDPDPVFVQFSLASYDGLTPFRVASGLASLIDADPDFSATANGVRITIEGADSFFGANVLSQGSDSLCADCTTTTPEPDSGRMLVISAILACCCGTLLRLRPLHVT